ncbi:basic proline-rich protein-like [Vombatus ursinus]|uniref:basic proline-rich protein-like n=1 Tax=Vombatus ursinus TaxID=29139 RepID=UPI000FFD9183|nr:basic proline-rich protein-like [Vombatus ursinus]
MELAASHLPRGLRGCWGAGGPENRVSWAFRSAPGPRPLVSGSHQLDLRGALTLPGLEESGGGGGRRPGPAAASFSGEAPGAPPLRLPLLLPLGSGPAPAPACSRHARPPRPPSERPRPARLAAPSLREGLSSAGTAETGGFYKRTHQHAHTPTTRPSGPARPAAAAVPAPCLCRRSASAPLRWAPLRSAGACPSHPPRLVRPPPPPRSAPSGVPGGPPAPLSGPLLPGARSRAGVSSPGRVGKPAPAAGGDHQELKQETLSQGGKPGRRGEQERGSCFNLFGSAGALPPLLVSHSLSQGDAAAAGLDWDAPLRAPNPGKPPLAEVQHSSPRQ